MSGKNNKFISQSDVEACDTRRKSVENAMAIMLSATNGPDQLFLEVLESYILGEITLEEMERRIDRFEYLGNDFDSNIEITILFDVMSVEKTIIFDGLRK